MAEADGGTPKPEEPVIGSSAAEPPPPPQRPSLIDAVVDLLQTARDWIRQELEAAVHDKVAVPMQRVGIAIGSMAAAGCLLVVGLIFVAIALLLLLAQALTWPGALGLIGFVYIVGAVVFLVIKSRSMIK